MNKISLVTGQVAQNILNIVRKACLQLIFFFKMWHDKMSFFLRGMIKTLKENYIFGSFESHTKKCKLEFFKQKLQEKRITKNSKRFLQFLELFKI